MTVPFHHQREVALEKALRAMLRAARAAVVAQERCDHWASFGTNSKRARAAEERRQRALTSLSDAEAKADEALNYG